jgi:hypothetical protein
LLPQGEAIAAIREKNVAFPTQYLFTVLEVSVRWGCTQAQIVDWAIAGELDLLYGFSPVRFGETSIGGLMSIDGNEVRPLFRQHAESARKVYLTQARPDTATAWQRITEPPHGVRVMASDIVISADEIERFEATHEISRKLHSGPGTPSKYDWDGFYVELIRRVHLDGIPERQKDLIAEMQDWFIGHSSEGEAPDESTIRRRIQAVWKGLKGEAA